MAEYLLFTVYDSKVERYLQPFCMRSPGEAMRAIYEAAQDPQSNFYKYPADYTLYQIGHWFDDTSEIALEGAKINLGLVLEIAQAITTARQRELGEDTPGTLMEKQANGAEPEQYSEAWYDERLKKQEEHYGITPKPKYADEED